MSTLKSTTKKPVLLSDLRGKAPRLHGFTLHVVYSNGVFNSHQTLMDEPLEDWLLIKNSPRVLWAWMSKSGKKIAHYSREDYAPRSTAPLLNRPFSLMR